MKHTVNIFRRNEGFTLVELILVMGIFITVLAIAGQSFNTIYSQSSRFSKSEETNIEGIIGLEVMRHDLEQMGFGLPWGFTSSITYAEATNSSGATLNDAPSAVPRAFVAANALGDFTSDYIGVKATTVGSTKASQRWTYMPFHNLSTSTGRVSQPVTWPINNLNSSDNVTIVRSNFNTPSDDHLLIVDPGNNTIFYSTYGYLSGGDTIDPYFPQNDQQTHMIYGVDSNSLRMPFNRADFFIKVPDATTASALPQFCAPLTGVLYKATINQSNGNDLYLPLLDCVADMQVVLGWDTSDSGKANNVNAYSSVPASDGTVATTIPAGLQTIIQGWLSNAQGVREHLKMVKVYILAQEGKRDLSYISPKASYVVGLDCNESSGVDCGSSLTRTYTLSTAQLQYRWKLYRIIVRPKNLFSNQH